MLDVVQISEQWNEDEPKLNKLGAEVSSFLRKGLFTKVLHPEISYLSLIHISEPTRR